MKKLNVLFYHAGSDSMAVWFKHFNHNVIGYPIDIDNSKVPYYNKITGFDHERIIKDHGNIDVLLVNPNCKSYSNNGLGHHRPLINNKRTPVTHLAKISDLFNQHILQLIDNLQPIVYIIENPRGHLEKMDFMKMFQDII